MENDLIFSQTFEVDYIPSVNQMLEAGTGGYHLSSEYKKYKQSIQTQITKGHQEFKYDGKHGIIAQYIFVLKNMYNKRDLDNVLKGTQDAIFQYFNVNDSFVIDLRAIKLLDKTLNKEYVKVFFKHSQHSASDYLIK